MSRSTASGVRKPKVSKANGINTCWLSRHAFSCLVTLPEAAFKAEIPAHLNMSKRTSLTKSCRYLNPGSSLQ
ncbi:hypothetical protein HanRHA438_Chr17g0837551 [Helianthus annuus]|nr:hypothetical protein HanRHA438_Chr17g0837551 [Helianthus annuus]